MDNQLIMGKYPDKIRRVIYWDEENKRKFIFFTSAFAEDERLDISPMMVAELYHNRWQIERSIYEMLQLASISLTKPVPLDKLFGKPNNNIVNELNGFTEPTLF